MRAAPTEGEKGEKDARALYLDGFVQLANLLVDELLSLPAASSPHLASAALLTNATHRGSRAASARRRV